MKQSTVERLVQAAIDMHLTGHAYYANNRWGFVVNTMNDFATIACYATFNAKDDVIDFINEIRKTTTVKHSKQFLVV